MACASRPAGDGEGLWSHCYGGSSWDGFAGVCAAPDGGYLLVGRTFSVDDGGP